jgi:hypothetical protein
MIGKKINQLATELAPVSTDLTIIGDPISGVSKKITLAQLGAIFSGAVSFYTDLASFPATGDINVIYCAKDTQKLYLWSGSAYVEVFPSQALLDTYQLRSEKGNANGYASLDSGGKVPISQLPSSIMEYKGTWNASTNTPTLANGTGDTGDVYICNVAGTVNFGAGAITFAVGDYVIYSGSIWQRSSGAVGTVTSVALTVGGDAISVSGSPLTTSGTLALAFSGTTSQYIRGNGTLANFPTSLVSGSGTANRLTKWSSTSGEIVNSNILDTGITITNLNATADFFSCQFNGNPTTGRSYGVLIAAGSNASDIAFRIEDVSSSSVYFYVWGDGRVQINNIPNATTDTDRFLVSDSGVIKYRTGAELLSDIGGASATGYVPYTGATANLDLGTHTLIAAKGTFSSSGSGDTVGITHSSGSGIALNITKGGNGEGLYINKTSGSGNAATIIGTLNATTLVKSGGTSSEFLKADGSVDSTSYGTGSVTSVGLSSATSGVTIGSTPITTSGTITLAIATASGSQQGLLSSTDWTTFNSKQNALTNPVTGTGTTNYLPKFTGTSTIGNSIVQDNGSAITIAGNVGVNGSPGTSFPLEAYINSSTAYTTSSRGNVMRVYNSNTGANIFAGIELGGAGTANDGLAGLNGVVTGSGSAALTFYTRNSNTFAEKMRLDASGNLGLGVTPSAWASGYKVAQYQGGFLGSDGTSYIYFGQNAYSDGTFKYLANGLATIYAQDAGKYIWYQAPSGTAGNAISFTQAMTLDASGNLMVGTTSPVTFSGYKTLSVNGSSGASFVTMANGTSAIRLISSTTDSAVWEPRNVDMLFATNNTTRLTIASTGAATFSGNLNVTVPNTPEVFLTHSNTSRTFLMAVDGSNAFFRANSTNNILFQVAGGTNVMALTSAGNVGIGNTNPDSYSSAANTLVIGTTSGNKGMTIASGNTSYGGIYFADGTTGNETYRGFVEYGHSADSLNFGTAAAERMRITSGGSVCIGVTSPTNSQGLFVYRSNFAAAFQTDAGTGQEAIRFFNGSTAVGTIATTSSSTAYNTSSDYRLKQDLKDFNGLDLLSKIKTYDYEWKADKTRSYGVIAHELQSVINYAVTGVKDGKEMQGVDYSKIVPVLIKAIQEQQTQIEQLKNK